jgi:flagellar motor protein MotB
MSKRRKIRDRWCGQLPQWVSALVVALFVALILANLANAQEAAAIATKGQQDKQAAKTDDKKVESGSDEKIDETGKSEETGEAGKADKAGKVDKVDKAGKADKAPPSEFLRIERKGKKPIAMQTSVVRYTPTENAKFQATVDLVGAVHVGEPEYYTELNKRFRDYDAVLFELVAPEGFELPKGEKLESKSGVGALQNVLKDVLGLQFQLDRIDYSAKNFVHADMSPEELSKSMKDRGESFLKMFIRMMGQGMSAQGKKPSGGSDIQLMFALIRRDQVTVKRIFAVQFEDMESTVSAFNGPNGSTIITERNKKALDVLSRELKNGKKKVAIFYGAGHLPDMEERLLKDFGLKKGEVDWLTAWDLTKAPAR